MKKLSYRLDGEKGNIIMNDAIYLNEPLTDDTRKQGIVIYGKVYSMHILSSNKVVITDNSDYTKIHAVMTLDFYNILME